MKESEPNLTVYAIRSWLSDLANVANTAKTSLNGWIYNRKTRTLKDPSGKIYENIR